jgi:hypothetical protein
MPHVKQLVAWQMYTAATYIVRWLLGAEHGAAWAARIQPDPTPISASCLKAHHIYKDGLLLDPLSPSLLPL